MMRKITLAIFYKQGRQSITDTGLKILFGPELGFKMIQPEELDKILTFMECNSESREMPLELRIKKKDGDTAWLELKVLPILDDQGEMKGVEGIARDISRDKRIDEQLAADEPKSTEELQRSEQRYRLIAEASQDLIYIIDPEDRIRFINSQGRQFL